MRSIRRTSRFLRDYKREKRGQYAKEVDNLLDNAIKLLANDSVLPYRYKYHPLLGKYTGSRDCHLKPDLILIYCKPNATTLCLERIGSHSELSLA